MPNNKKTNKTIFGAFIAALLTMQAIFLVGNQVHSFKTQNGITLRVIQDQQMSFIHAQVLILFDFSDLPSSHFTPSIPEMTVFHLFAKEIDEPSSPLLRNLRRLGGDYQLEMKPDFLRISLNFPNDRLPNFGAFLKELYNYNHFFLKKFNNSLENYWSIFFRQENWKSILAERIGYSFLFPDQPLGWCFTPYTELRQLNLFHLRSFYRNSFQPQRSKVIIKSNVNPHVTLGLLERSLHGSGDSESSAITTPTLSPQTPRPDQHRKIVFFAGEDSEPPLFTWLEPLPDVNHPDHLAHLTIHQAIFAFPGGRIYQQRFNRFTARAYQFTSEVIHHRGVSVIKHQTMINYPDIEPLISLIDQEKRRLLAQPLDRREYLEAVNYFLNKAKVSTADFEQEVNNEVFQFIAGFNQPFNKWLPTMVRKLSPEKTNNVVAAILSSGKDNLQTDLGGTIVIIGNRDPLIRQSFSFTVEWIRQD